MCIVAARVLFEVPIRGSLLAVLLTSMAYLMVSLLLGLYISGATRNQFAASQMALLTSFMPAMMLSGFVFDLRNVPLAVKVVSQIVPATHFMGVIKTLFLAGTDRSEGHSSEFQSLMRTSFAAFCWKQKNITNT